MRFLNAEATRAALPMSDAIAAMEHAFSAESEAPLRTLVGPSLVMPAQLGDLMAIKVVSTIPGNPAGMVAVFDDEGRPVGIADGPTVTAIRTAAGSGLATKLMSREDARTLVMIGSGAMAYDQIEAVRTVRDIRDIYVWSRKTENAKTLAERVKGNVVTDIDQAVAQADVVSCATPATEPLFLAESVRPGTHINAVGAFTPEMAELAPDLLVNAYVVVDDREAAAAEAGDLIRANRDPDATLRDLIAGNHAPITKDVTVFKSVGVAAQDVAAAGRALANAERDGIGLEVS